MADFQKASRLNELTIFRDPKEREVMNQLIKTLRQNFDALQQQIDVSANTNLNYATVTAASYDVTLDVYLILADTTANDIDINLPPAADMIRRLIYIKKTTADSNTVTVIPDGSEELDNDVSFVIVGGSLGSVTIFCDGSNWWVI